MLNQKKTHYYKDRNGAAMGYVERMETSSDKSFYPSFKKIDGRFERGISKTERPLYGLDRLAQSDQDFVIVVEGEKDVDSLSHFDFVAVTSFGGCEQAHLSDWSPLKEFQKVLLLPDNDPAGRKYAASVRDILFIQNPSVDVHELVVGEGEKEDISDWLGQNACESMEETKNKLLELFEKKHRFQPNWNDLTEISAPKGPSKSFLPGKAGEFSESVSAHTENPVAFNDIIFLAGWALACQGRYCVELSNGHTMPLTIYALLAMQSGNRKSSCVKAVLKPHSDFRKKVAQESVEKNRAVKGQNKAIEAKIDKLRKDSKTLSGGELQRSLDEIQALDMSLQSTVKAPQIYTTDSTPEALPTQAASNQGRIGLFSDESGSFFNFAGDGKSRRPNLDGILKLYDGGEIVVGRVGTGLTTVDEGYATILLTPQPKLLFKLLQVEDFEDRGLMARFVLALFDSKAGYRVSRTPPLDLALATWYKDRIDALLSLEKKTNLRYTVDAEKFRDEIHDECQRSIRPGGKFECLAEWSSKFPGLVDRIAGLFTVMKDETLQAEQIDLDTLRSAYELAKYIKEAVYHVYYAAKNFDPEIRRISKWLSKRESRKFTERDFHQDLFKRNKKEHAITKLKKVVDIGLVRPLTVQATSNRPSVLYEVRESLCR